MSIWRWIGEAAESGVGALGALVAWTGGLFGRIRDPATRRQVAFSMALIALSAKMAKADGVVTSSEVAAFRQMFAVPVAEEGHVTRLFDLATRDVAGYDAYAARIASLYADDRDGLVDVIDGLFVIAKADGAVHEAEYRFLRDVAGIFGIGERAFERIAARHVVPEEGDPYVILGAERDWPFERVRRHYRKLVADNHPDKLIARGVPEEFIALANDRLAALNGAFERIKASHAREAG